MIPIVLAISLLVRRVLPRWAVLPAQIGLFASAVVVLYAYPLLGGWGHTARARAVPPAARLRRQPRRGSWATIWLVCALGPSRPGNGDVVPRGS